MSNSIRLIYDHGVHMPTRTLYMGYGKDETFDLDQSLARDLLIGLHILSTEPSHVRDILKESTIVPISIIVNNMGGDQQHGFAIYDYITEIRERIPVHITIRGYCHSMASWILQAGTVRRMSRNSQMMIHDGGGKKNKFYRDQDQVCIDILLGRIREKDPHFSRSKLVKMLAQDTFLNAEEALELGLIDEIV